MSSVRILILHNAYKFAGGEDRAVVADQELLRSRGHETLVYHRSFNELEGLSPLTTAGLATQAFWSRTSYVAIRKIVDDWRPDVAHFHNIVPLISPSGYEACRAAGVPVVQTLHNYRLICPAGTLLRDGVVCELCVGKSLWPSIHYSCYRGSRRESVVLAGSLTAHRLLGTWDRRVDAYIALTTFGKEMFIKGGLPADRIHVRHNALDVPTPAQYRGPHSAIFVGRLSPEKGVRVLLNAWATLPEIPLTIVGDGPLMSEVRDRVAKNDMRHVKVVGELPHHEVLERVRAAGMLIFPSLWYEGLGYAMVEALSLGIPIIASKMGVQLEVVIHGVTGLHFTPGDPSALVAAVQELRSSDGLAGRLAEAARRDFLERYSPEQSYGQLMNVYSHVGASA
ncbi:MAG: glycosyltransferase family 4 protein [Chloroflexota bacterium]